MKVVIIRHAEVDFRWSRRCTSEGFDSDCSRYDIASIKKIKYGMQSRSSIAGKHNCSESVEYEKVYQRIYISELSRSLDTAEILFPDCDYTVSGLINEVPLRSSFDTKKTMPLWFWNILGRLQWLMNSTRQAESRNKTASRARQFVTMICDENTDCAVVTHGFFMHTLLNEMKKAGFRTNKSSAAYKNGEYVIAEK